MVNETGAFIRFTYEGNSPVTKNLLIRDDNRRILPHLKNDYLKVTRRMVMKKTTSRIGTAATAVALLTLTSCSGLDDTQQKLLSGGAAGAVIGTVTIAATGGCIPCGTAVGGVVGAAAGYLLDQLDKSTKSNNSSMPN